MVDLPLPEAPTIPIDEPARILSWISFKTVSCGRAGYAKLAWLKTISLPGSKDFSSARMPSSAYTSIGILG